MSYAWFHHSCSAGARHPTGLTSALGSSLESGRPRHGRAWELADVVVVEVFVAA